MLRPLLRTRGVGIAMSPSKEVMVYKQDTTGGSIAEVIKAIVGDIISTMTEVCEPQLHAVSDLPCGECLSCISLAGR